MKKITWKQCVVAALAIVVTTIAALKAVFQDVLRKDGPMVYAATAGETTADSFVFDGVEVRLPWSQITNVFVTQNTIIMADMGDKKFNIHKMAMSSNFMPPKTTSQSENYFVRDLGRAMAHPDQFDHLQLPRVRNVTWTSNPVQDLRIAIGLLILRISGGIQHMNPIENDSMRGFQVEIWTKNSGRAQVCHLAMQNGSGQLLIMMFEGTDPFLSPLLGSIRIVKVLPNFPQKAFEESKKLSKTSHGNSELEKIALLKAIEAASNSPPNLMYFTQVLELSRQDHVSKLGRAWLGSTLHFFPAAQSSLQARFPEFFPKNTAQSK